MESYDKIPDIVLLVLLAGAAFDGFSKGLSEELLNVILTVMALLLSSMFYMPAADLLVEHVPVSGALLYGLSFLICLLVALIGLKLLKAILKQKIDFSFGMFVERFFGAVAGAAKMLVFIAAFILIVSIWRHETIYTWTVEKSKIAGALSNGLQPVYKKVQAKIDAMPKDRGKKGGGNKSDPAGDPLKVGDRSIHVPAPEGYVRLTPDMSDIYGFHEAMAKADAIHDLLATYVLTEDRATSLTGVTPPLKKYFTVKVNKVIAITALAPEDFETYKETMKSEQMTYAGDLSDLLDKAREAERAGLTEADPGFIASRLVMQEPHTSTDRMVSYSGYLNTGDTIEAGDETKHIAAMNTTALYVGQKILLLYAYAPHDEIEWARSASIDWAEATLANDPESAE
ncbi:MAG: CvpA family protein, partial [Verrucomicrobiota bacterium]